MRSDVERNMGGEYTHIYEHTYKAVLQHAVLPCMGEEDLFIYRIRCSTVVIRDTR